MNHLSNIFPNALATCLVHSPAEVVKPSRLHPLVSAKQWENACHFRLLTSRRGTATSTVLLEPYLQMLSLEWESFCLSSGVGRGADPSSHKCTHRGSLASHSQGGRDTTHHPGIPGHGSVSVSV